MKFSGAPPFSAMSTPATMEFIAAAAVAAADIRQVRRGMRALLRQGGGVMLMRLHSCGAAIRMDAEMTPHSVALRVVSSHEEGAAAVMQCGAALREECARCQRALDRLEVAAPSPVQPPAAPARLPQAA